MSVSVPGHLIIIVSSLALVLGDGLTLLFPRLASQPPSRDPRPFRLRRAQPAGHAIRTNLLYGTEKCQSLYDASERIADTLFYSSCHQEPILTRICKELRRERSEDFDPGHSILSGWYVFLN
jgi:hypothetical protein